MDVSVEGRNDSASIQYSTFHIHHLPSARERASTIETPLAAKLKPPGASNGDTLAARRRPGGADARECRHFTAGRQKATPPSPVCRPGEPTRGDAAVSRPEYTQYGEGKSSAFGTNALREPA